MPRLPPRYDVPKAAPEPLRLVQELVNTADFENRIDFLSGAGELAEWLSARDLPAPSVLHQDDLEETRELREALRALLVANGGHELDAGAIERLNRIAAEGGLALHFGPDGSARLEPAAGGVRAAHAALLAIVHQAMAAGTWSRLKACPQCSWAFYDYSKNRSATWCSMQLCGNRRKTREYRARRRAAAV